MLNRVELIGRVTQAPELGYTPHGTAFCELRVATHFQVNGVTRSEFHVVVAWSALAEQCAGALRKGELVHVDGRMQTESWDNFGVRRQRTRIVAFRIIFLGPGRKAAAHGVAASRTSEPEPNDSRPAPHDIDPPDGDPESPGSPIDE